MNMNNNMNMNMNIKKLITSLKLKLFQYLLQSHSELVTKNSNDGILSHRPLSNISLKKKNKNYCINYFNILFHPNESHGWPLTQICNDVGYISI